MSRAVKLRLAFGTDPGLQRQENEDSVLVWKEKAGVDALLVVCDGMGGHAAGRLASSIAVETFASTLAGDGGKGADPNRLREASIRTNTAVHMASMENPEWQGMGSTLTVVAIEGSKLALVNVGDSPAYLFRDGKYRLISQDHSWPAEQVRLGVIKPEDAKDHPMKHRLTRAIGVWDQIASFTDVIDLQPGDSVVLCSDGVETAGVSVEEMWAMLTEGSLEDGIRKVIDRCRELGAPDNVTVAVATVEGERDRDRMRLDRIGKTQVLSIKTVTMPKLKAPED
ncbi:MAG: serine/threonine-protein phosphatase [Chloroflexi bacterium]|nr:MAG: serine/threonine-protein phosphatase [Chloroflexota bacterium]